MTTKQKIKIAALSLFNQKGFRNITLRNIAEHIGKSYGNVTYHYSTKDDLLLELFDEMALETSEIITSFDPEKLFFNILNAPKITFKITLKYSFFYIDYVEIKRNYPEILTKLEESTAIRAQGYLSVLQSLQKEGILREELTSDDLIYLMELSGAMRTFFFINLEPEAILEIGLEKKYINYVNKLVLPYLTIQGRKEYELHC